MYHLGIAVDDSRNDRITRWVQSELERLASFEMFDRVFTMQRTWADLRLMDGAIDPSDREVGVCYAGDPRWANYSPFGIGHCNSLRTWLSMWSLESSPCRGGPHLENRAEKPALRAPRPLGQPLVATGAFPAFPLA